MPYPKQDLPAETSAAVAASAAGPGVAAVNYCCDELHTTGIEVEKICSSRHSFPFFSILQHFVADIFVHWPLVLFKQFVWNQEQLICRICITGVYGIHFEINERLNGRQLSPLMDSMGEVKHSDLNKSVSYAFPRMKLSCLWCFFASPPPPNLQS